MTRLDALILHFARVNFAAWRRACRLRVQLECRGMSAQEIGCRLGVLPKHAAGLVWPRLPE